MVSYPAVVTPVYATRENNRFDYFQNTAKSILAQDLDFRWIVVDDSSPDSRLSDYLQNLNDPRLKVLRRQRSDKDPKTSSNALNFGFDYAVKETLCDCFTYVHSDDILPKGSIEDRISALTEFDMVYGISLIYNADLNLMPSLGRYKNPFDTKNMKLGFPHHTSFWSKQFFLGMIKKRNGVLFNPSLSCAEDLDVTYCARELFEDNEYKLGFLDKVVYIWVSSPNITSETSPKEVNRQLKELVTKKEYKYHEKFEIIEKLIRTPGFFFPEQIKRIFRPYIGYISRLSGGFFYPNTNNYVPKEEIDLFWFNSEAIKNN